MKIQVSLSLEKNNLSKKSKLADLDLNLKQIEQQSDLLTKFEHLCNLPQSHKALLDISWNMIVILDKDQLIVGGCTYFEYPNNCISIRLMKLKPVAQSKGIFKALLEHILKEHGGLYSSPSISAGAAKIFKQLSDKYSCYLVWPEKKVFAKISSWKSSGLYEVFPFVLAPNGTEYPIDTLEETGRVPVEWKSSEIYLSTNKKPPVGFKEL